jgi:hypothetical protein
MFNLRSRKRLCLFECFRFIGRVLLTTVIALTLSRAASPRAALAEELGGNGAPKPAENAAAAAPAEEHPYGFGEWWLFGGQTTGVAQVNTRMKSPYDNPAISYGPKPSLGWSVTATLYGAFRLWPGASVVAEPEFADGGGMPNVSGLAGYVNGEIVRVAKVGILPYVARAYIRQSIPLGGAPTDEKAEFEERFAPTGPGPFAVREANTPFRLEIVLGEFAMNDFFDASAVAADPRRHFLNWSLMEQGSWDYPADTRGYTTGGVISLEHPDFALRAGTAAMPTAANAPNLDWDVHHNGSVMAEGEARYRPLDQPGSAKLLYWSNWAHMGSYADALNEAAPGKAPDVTAVEKIGARKQGVGLLVDQQFGKWVNAFFRIGASDGKSEVFVFTEIDRDLSAGAEIAGEPWQRPDDRLAVAVALNGISPIDGKYLAAGGVTYQLGDGGLRRATETVIESYYVFGLWRYLELTLDAQGIFNPGMNADRGPVGVFGVRFHVRI